MRIFLKPLSRLAILAALGISSVSFSSISDPFSDVIRALGGGNTSLLSSYFGPTVEISILGQTDTYDKKQGEGVLRKFFTIHRVNSFSLLHRGSEGSEYGIGTLVTRNGTFRTTFFLQESGKFYVLRELRFDTLSQ